MPAPRNQTLASQKSQVDPARPIPERITGAETSPTVMVPPMTEYLFNNKLKYLIIN